MRLFRLVGRIAGLKRGFTIHESRACAGQGAMLIVPSRKHKTRQAKHDALNHENAGDERAQPAPPQGEFGQGGLKQGSARAPRKSSASAQIADMLII